MNQQTRAVLNPPLEAFETGAEFSATWTLTNHGPQTWTGNYILSRFADFQPFNQDATPYSFGVPLEGTLAELTGVAQVLPGQSLTITLPLVAPVVGGEEFVCHFQLRDEERRPVGDVLYVRTHVLPGEPLKGAGFVLPSPLPALKSPPLLGVNINPDGVLPQNLAAELAGLKVARVVFKTFIREQYPKRNEPMPLAERIEHYRRIVNDLNARGVTALLVLNQETVVPAGGWQTYARWYTGWSPDDYRDYIENRFRNTVQKIAEEFRGSDVIYQIWNEGDCDPAIVTNKGQFAYTDVYTLPIQAGYYGWLLQTSLQVIRRTDPAARVIAMGMVMPAGPGPAVDYLQRAFEGKPWLREQIDGMAAHPYLRQCRDCNFTFNRFYGDFRQIVDSFHDAFRKPVWITEVGAKIEDDGKITAHELARFIESTIFDLSINQHGRVAAVCWFPWSDFVGTRESTRLGLVELNHAGAVTRKPEVNQAFGHMRDWLARPSA